MGRRLQELERWIGTREEGVWTIVGGNFNVRIEREGGEVEGEEDWEGEGEGGESQRTMRVGDRVDSDHQPVEVWIKGGRVRRRERGKKRRGWRGVWDEEGRKEFVERLGRVETGGEDLEAGRKEVEKRIVEVLEEVEKGRNEGSKKRGWWDEKCKMKKREVRKELREWRRMGMGESIEKRKEDIESFVREKEGG